MLNVHIQDLMKKNELNMVNHTHTVIILHLIY